MIKKKDGPLAKKRQKNKEYHIGASMIRNVKCGKGDTTKTRPVPGNKFAQ